jgi:hypothetical protein
MDSDGGSFSELPDHDMSEVNSPFSSSNKEEEKKEVAQLEPDRGSKRTYRATHKCSNIDFELG